jgi:hypothetical protein
VVSETSGGLCIPHKNRGRLVPAVYTLGGVGFCKQCWAERENPKPSAPKPEVKEDVVPKTAEVDWSAVQRDRDAGVPVSDLVKKYGVSNPTIYTRTHGSGKKPAGGAKTESLAALSQRRRREEVHQFSRSAC